MWGKRLREEGEIAVITVEPADKSSFVYNCMQTRLRGQYNGKWPISLACVSRPLVTVITAIGSKSREEGEIGSESREEGDLPPSSSPLNMRHYY